MTDRSAGGANAGGDAPTGRHGGREAHRWERGGPAPDGRGGGGGAGYRAGAAGVGGGGDGDDGEASAVETELRRMLAERAAGAAPREAPYDSIVRRGRWARRRGRAVLGAGAAVLIAVPGVAIGAHQDWLGGDGRSSVAASPSAAPSESAAGAGSGASADPAGPADPERQLLDGITFEQAADSLARCIADWGGSSAFSDHEQPDIEIGELRILLAWVSQGDDNRGAEPIRQVLAVSDDPSADPHFQLVCADRGEAAGSVGMQTSTDTPSDPGPAVRPEPGAGRYLGPMMGEWTMPFRWAHFGTLDPEVVRVTVEYAGATEEAVVEAGYFAVAGMGEDAPGGSPVIKGYGADGEVLYDSAEEAVPGQG
ncbi:hypothetical protein [Streptomyces sp. MP131-18]|uniref:hypothetical protein n=1 Tax=Streptomyces sp. MP131-18 TaxID=1857892 RepID=UPI00097CA13A|nr:hypothetical protein [Streptomyces sp. MP131-18]ONK11898.1 hypothetical protein STBA_26340 [Streptomyces sp. MP131-18]